MTYDYSEATVVLGPLAARREPNAYDLCQQHAASLTAPQGWQVIRLAVSEGPANPDDEDLEVLANLVRKVSNQNQSLPAGGRRGNSDSYRGEPADASSSRREPTLPAIGGDRWWGPAVARYGHLRVIPGASSAATNRNKDSESENTDNEYWGE